jgi:hypothetical protein
MAVFFSGTDNSELVDNAPNYNYYFSLIVNNKNEMTARVAFVTDIETVGKRIVKFKDTNGEEISVEKDITLSEQKVYFYDCVITKPSVIEDSRKRIAEIRASKPVTFSSTNYGNYGRIGGANGGSYYQQPLFPQQKPVTQTWQKEKEEEKEAEKKEWWEKLGQRVGSWSDKNEPTYSSKETTGKATFGKKLKENVDYEAGYDPLEDDANFESAMDYEEALEDVAIRCVLCDTAGNFYERFTSLEEALDYTAEKKDKIPKKEWYTFCEKVKDSYHYIYHSHFNDPEVEHIGEVSKEIINLIKISAPIGTNLVVKDITEIIEDAIK